MSWEIQLAILYSMESAAATGDITFLPATQEIKWSFVPDEAMARGEEINCT